ncbi:MAG TPA: nucleoside hydrolase-like domain-containing protein, partial [Draconibacterium sp.]|nr:nucleoside hydrolase-like domain-containing protein [Draconibacterium sp.]
MKKLFYQYLFPLSILLNSFLCSGSVSKQKEISKPRIIVTTDGEIDDKTSFMRFLLYSNEFDIEGLIYGNSMWQKHGHGVVWMQEMIDEYGKIRPNLLKHLPGYPTVDELKKIIYAGNMEEKYLDYSGPLETEGAKHIINILL